MQELNNATALPFVPARFGQVRGGVYRQDGQRVTGWPVLGSSHARSLVAPATLPRLTDDVAVPQAIYGGVWFNHFGHFLTETLPNLAAILSASAPDDPRPIHFQTLHSDLPDLAAMPSFIGDFLAMLGLDPARLCLIARPTRFARLWLPPAPFTRRFRYGAALPGMLDAALGLRRRRGAGRNIYFTRAGIASKGRNAEVEAQLEGVFAARGFEIVSPETLSIAAQLELVADAATIAGQNGSALHWALLARDLETVIELGWQLKLQRGICAVRGQRYLSLPGAGFSRFLGRQQRRLPAAYLEKNLRDFPPNA